MSRPIAVVVGFAGKLPLAGMALANIHTMTGLVDLGYHVHYVERQNGPKNCYDPDTREMTDDPTPALSYLQSVLPRYGWTERDYSFIDLQGRCHGSGWGRLRDALTQADFVLDMGDATWFDELGLCSRRGFIDVDPMFTQVQLLSDGGRKAETTSHFDTAFSHGVRIGKPDCSIPLAGRHWIPARTAIVTRFWQADMRGADRPITTLMNWTSGREITHEDQTYGYKNREFERVMRLPSLTDWTCVVAMGGGAAPRDRLREFGWQIVNPLEASRTIDAYHAFIAGSAADFGVAKHAYVASKSGWFSDRSTCYMASGRPVLHQDTGIGDWLPTGEGVLLFGTLAEAIERLRELRLDYQRHSRAARAIAEEYFEASTVLKNMLHDAGWA